MSVLAQVESGSVQLGLVGQQVDRTQLNYRPFATDELLLVIGRDDQWRRRRKVRIADVLRRSVILRDRAVAGVLSRH